MPFGKKIKEITPNIETAQNEGYLKEYKGSPIKGSAQPCEGNPKSLKKIATGGERKKTTETKHPGQ